MKDEIAENAAMQIAELEERATAQNSNLYHPVWKQKVQDAIAEACRKASNADKLDKVVADLNDKMKWNWTIMVNCDQAADMFLRLLKTHGLISELTPKEMKD